MRSPSPSSRRACTTPTAQNDPGRHVLISAALSPCDTTNRRLFVDFLPIRTQVNVRALPVTPRAYPIPSAAVCSSFRSRDADEQPARALERQQTDWHVTSLESIVIMVRP